MRGMRIVVGMGLVAAYLLSMTGCGSKSEGGVEARSASIPGSPAGSDEKSPAANGNKDKAGAASFDPDHPTVVIDTSLGEMVVTLDRKAAPLTVANFLKFVNKGHYDQTIFHQVLKDYVMMAGGFTEKLQEKKTADPPVRNEAHNGLKNLRGTIAMVRRPDVIDSSTCQFYLNVADNPNLDFKGRTPDEYGYCVFGRVTKGLEVVDKIAVTPVQDRPEFERIPTQTVLIRSIRQTH